MKFTVSNNERPDIVFRAEIDDDGDLMLYANGYKLLFITHRTGCLVPMDVPDDQLAALAGLSFNKKGRITISV
jgi:hypothetical protein